MANPTVYSNIFSATSLQTQEEMLAVTQQKKRLFIGIPKEDSFQETRVPLIPSSVATLVAHGHRVVVEKDAGEKSNFTSKEYAEAGAEIAYSKDKVFEANVILKVTPPSSEEIDFFHPNQIIISPIHLPTLSLEYIQKIRQKRVIALAWEYIKNEDGLFPLVNTISKIAGMSAMLTAGELLSSSGGGKGILLGGIIGVPPAKVVILGSGVAAEYAIRTATGLGAQVRVFDDNVYKLTKLQHRVGFRPYTSTLDPYVLERELQDANVVIGAMHSPTGRVPIVVSEEMVAKMQTGAVIIDISIDQGGCIATSRLTTHDNPTYKTYGVLHYCVPNIASKVTQTASQAISNIIKPILLQAENSGSIEQLIYDEKGLRNGVYTYKGSLTNEYLAKKFQLKYTNIDLLLASKL